MISIKEALIAARTIRATFVVLSFSCISFCSAEAPETPGRQKPSSIPSEAEWNEYSNEWFTTIEDHNVKVYQSWDAEGRRKLRSASWKDYIELRSYSENGHLSRVSQTVVVDCEDSHGRCPVPVTYGFAIDFHENGNIRSRACYDPSNPSDSSVGTLCGTTTDYYDNGQVRNITKTGVECTRGCGRFRPLFDPGRYTVGVSELVLREGPGVTRKSIAKLKKNESVEVLENTYQIETIDFETAPWLKVKASDGRTGYVFGGFLKDPKEPW